MATFRKAPTSNYWSTTLNGAINDSVQTITLTSTTGLQAPGVIVVNREDGSGTATASAREVIHFTGISGSDLTGCTRGEENSTARSHNDGSLVESVFTVETWNDVRDAVSAVISTDGANIAVTGTASIAALITPSILNDTFASTSIASIARLETAQIVSPIGSFINLAVTSIASIAAVNIPAINSASASITTLNAATGNITSGNLVNIAATSTASVNMISYNASKPLLSTASDGATVTFDMNISNLHTLSLATSRTLAVSNVGVGQPFVIRLKQGIAGCTVTWWTDINWDNNTVPTLTTTINLTDVFGFLKTSATDYDGFVLGQGIPV